jgi:hypothetical protein
MSISMKRRGAPPRRRGDLNGFPVGNELVLLPADGEHLYALNETGAAIWQLCDGSRSLADVVSTLNERYGGDSTALTLDIAAALSQMQDLGLIESASTSLPTGSAVWPGIQAGSAERDRPPVRFVVAIEDLEYFHWQVAILLESLVAQLPLGWDITIVVCNDGAPVSGPLAQILDVYGVRMISAASHSRAHPIDFSSGESGYVALHRVEGLKAIAPIVDNEDVVCLMDSDIFLYGDLREEVFPTGNAMATNWILSHKPFLGASGDGRGIDLQGLLSAIGCDTPVKPGGVTVFLDGATLRSEKFIQDCFRFGQILFLLGKTADLSDRSIWMAEMACFALAATANRIDYTLLDAREFKVPDPDQEDLPSGSFFHYYVDINDGSGGVFRFSEWHKQLFRERSLLNADLDSFRIGASSPLEKRFFDLAMAARLRMTGQGCVE